MNNIGQILLAATPDAPAFRAPGSTALTYEGLARLVGETGGAIRGAGIGRKDRVAIAMPNGARLATCFLAVANACTAAPLNTAYGVEEFKFYMDDLGVRLLLTDDLDGAATTAAKQLNVSVMEVSGREDAPAGLFTLSAPAAPALPLSEVRADDQALVLHTSGTTARPKAVPLTHAMITKSAENVARSLGLTSEDTCLNIMPLFHIHGLVAGMLASLVADGTIYCTPAFNAFKIFAWMDDANPSWYTAVPTMHQAILARAPNSAEVISSIRLRFIRSSSSSLPPTVMDQLQRTFDCPVIEAYGMTEAAHQMAANPSAPGRQRPGSVGLAAGPELRLFRDGELTEQSGVTGEIVIRGRNVMAGYENNEEANADSFVPDPQGEFAWFRTGDEGRFDPEGYLYITGRLKEIINRGGEKISPREVDEVLMEHGAIDQAVTFAVPHDRLGEEIEAAVVLRDGQVASPEAIRTFVRGRLARFKVPRRILIVDKIPKSSTGKVQRVGLHKTLSGS